MNSDGIVDHEALKGNIAMKEQAQALINEESTKFKIYSYQAILLRLEIVE